MTNCGESSQTSPYPSNINMAAARTLESSASENIIYQADNVYQKVRSKRRHQTDELVYGCLLLVHKHDGHHIEWNPSQTSFMKLDSTESAEDWGVINNVGFRNSKTSDDNGSTHEAGQLYTTFPTAPHISFCIDQLTSVKIVKKVYKTPSSISFNLKTGVTHGPLYFQNGGSSDFLSQIETIVYVKRYDRNTYMVEPHKPGALSQSLQQLHLYQDPQHAVQRFVKNPLQATISGFAKVTKLLSDTFVPENADTEIDPEISAKIMQMSSEIEPVCSDGASASVDSAPEPIDTSQPDEPEYAFVDETLNLKPKNITPRDNPLTRERWNALRDDEGRVRYPEEVKRIVFRGGIVNELRSEVWKYLLGYYPWKSTEEERVQIRDEKLKEYFVMKLQWKSVTASQENRWSMFKELKHLIEKDVNRTDRTMTYFAGEGNDKLVMLNDILMTYMMYNFNLGYVQGMSDILSPLLFITENEVDAFWCFVGFMEMIESNFEESQAGMKKQLTQLNLLLQVMDKDLFNHLEKHDSSNMYFAFRWLLILFKREFSMDETFKIWEVYWTGMPCKNYQLIIALEILLRKKDIIIGENLGFTEILKLINELSGKMSVDQILSYSEALAEQILTCNNLPSYISNIFELPTNLTLTASPPDQFNESVIYS